MTEEVEQPAPETRHTVRLTAAQTQAAKDRVYARSFGPGFTYWTPMGTAPFYPTRREAEEASIQEWRDNL